MVKIVADSVCDLSNEIIDRYGITITPIKIIEGEHSYRDGIDISKKEIYDRLKDGVRLSTSQINPFEFENVFRNLTDNGDEVIAIILSSKLSGTYNSAVIAKNELDDRKIEVIDSKGGTLGQGMIVLEAAKMANEGKSILEIKNRVCEMADNMEYLVIVDTLEYLYRGGRISKTQYIVGSLLNVKIIAAIENGEIVVRGKVRGQKKALGFIKDYIKKKGIDLNGKTVGINYISNEKLYEDMLKIVGEYSPKEIINSDIGCTVASYLGLESIGIYFER